MIVVVAAALVHVTPARDQQLLSKELLSCGLMPRSQALECLNTLTKDSSSPPITRAAEVLRRSYKTSRSEESPVRRSPLLLYRPELDLARYSGVRLRGGPQVFEVKVGASGQIITVDRKSPSTGSPALDSRLDHLVRRVLVLPEVKSGQYIDCNIVISIAIDVK